MIQITSFGSIDGLLHDQSVSSCGQRDFYRIAVCSWNFFRERLDSVLRSTRSPRKSNDRGLYQGHQLQKR